MATCKKCGYELAAGSKFCSACGEPVYETVFCTNCGEKTSTEFAACPNCGASLAEEPAAPPSRRRERRSRRLPRCIVPIALGIVVLAAVLLLLSLLSGGSDSYGLYLKDGALIYDDFSKNGAHTITEDLMADVDAAGANNFSLYFATDLVKLYTSVSEDGKRIFFPDHFSSYDDGISLYYRRLDRIKKDAEKVDSDIVQYAINSTGTGIVYIKDNVLYWNDLNNKEKLAAGVGKFFADDDCKKVGYEADGGFYLWSKGKEPEKLIERLDELIYVSNDFSQIYYIHNGALYKQTRTGDAEKIASDVCNVISVSSSGEIYYTVAEQDLSQKSMLDFMTDDFAETDAEIAEPEPLDYPKPPEKPYMWDHDTNEAYEAAMQEYEELYEVYEKECDEIDMANDAAYEVYYEKQMRDQLRETLKLIVVDAPQLSTLHYHDGKKDTILAESVVVETLWDEIRTVEKPVATFRVYDDSLIPKIDISELNPYEYQSDAHYRKNSDLAYQSCIAAGESVYTVDMEEPWTLFFSPDGRKAYYFTDSDVCDLYRISLDKAPISVELIADRVYYEEYDFVGNALLFLTDWEDAAGTLCLEDGKEVKPIAENVSQYTLMSDGDILCLTDYSTRYCSGTLCLYGSGGPKELTDDVVALVPGNENAIKGGFYGW